MNRLCTLALLFLLSTARLLCQSMAQPDQAKNHVGELLGEATRLLAEGKIDMALEKFRQARILAPDDIDALTGLARAESLHKDKDGIADMLTQAQTDYQTVLKSRPTAQMYTELGEVFYDRVDYTAAINAFGKALDLSPQFLAAEMGYGHALTRVGDFDNAVDVYSRACAQSSADHPEVSGRCGSAGIAADRGWAYFSRQDCRSLSLAEEDYRGAIALKPGDADLHFRFAVVLEDEAGSPVKSTQSNCVHSESERTAYFNKAWDELRNAVNLDSTNALYREGFVVLSELLKRKPEYDGGTARAAEAAELSQLVPNHPPVHASNDSLESLEALEDAQISAEHNKALAAAKEQVRLNPTDGFAWYALGQAYMKLNDYGTAEEPLRRALEAFKTTPPPYDPNDQNPLKMIGYTELALADVCDKLHRKGEATRYRRAANFILSSH